MNVKSAIAAFYASSAFCASAAFATPTLTTLATFTGAANGQYPEAGLIADASGNLYGTTEGGGSSGVGTVFKIAAGSNTLNTLVNFSGTANGVYPNAGLLADASGNMYGTTNGGGSSGAGTVFKIATGSNTFSTLVTFTGTANGFAHPLLQSRRIACGKSPDRLHCR